jgi:DNA-binding CsgD family transcriptional regulator/tetratricopeptide (TPR) repeat protein
MMLLGRRAECEALDQILVEARAGRSRVTVLRGEPGVGKSALLDYVSEQVDGWHVATATGVESEMELAYSGLHQLCAPMLDRLDRLPVPQRDALATVFGRCAGPAPEQFLVGLATLTLFADVAEQQPLVCMVDDAHWLDRASAQILGFVARRLLAERVALICAARGGIGDDVLGGLPELAIGGLGDSDARALLLGNVYGPLDAAVCDQIITESHGNPLALLELPRTWNAADLAGGFGLLDGHAVAGKIEQSYDQRLRELPSDTQLLVLAAAAEPLGDPVLLHRAAGALGIDMAAADPAVDAALLTIGARVEFAHPLVRSAAYRSAPADDRHRVHRALAEATDPATDPDRRAWHRARAAAGPGEEVAAELERSAGRAQARGGFAAAAAFLQRAVALTVDPTRRAERALAAAQASLQSGAFDAALGLLATAESGPLDQLQRARVGLLRGLVASSSSFGSAAAQLLKAAGELEPLNVDLARETYLNAWGAALAAGELASAGSTLRDISQAVRTAPRPAHEPLPSDLLLDGVSELIVEGLAAAVPTLRKAVSAFRHDDEVLQWGATAATAAAALWDMEGFRAVIDRQLQLARDAGTLPLLATALQGGGIVVTWSGDFRKAASVTAEAVAVSAATGVRIAPYGGMLLAAYEGREAEASALFKTTTEEATARGEGLGVQYARWATALLFNGLGRYGEALTAAQQASDDTPELFVSHWALVELVEAAARTGNAGLAAEAVGRLADATRASESDWGLGVSARSRALTSEGKAADALYLEAIARLGRTPVRPELARTHLVYGEWLRREGRRVDARGQLRTAHDMLAAIGMGAFRERARRELLATGEKARTRSAETRDELTPQEEQIARLARDGLSNPEIGSQLFISARTVEWHLHKVFGKLGISSRRQLRAALSEESRTLVRA